MINEGATDLDPTSLNQALTFSKEEEENIFFLALDRRFRATLPDADNCMCIFHSTQTVSMFLFSFKKSATTWNPCIVTGHNCL